MITFYVYVHYRLDTLDPFYVGKGHSNRAFHKSGRTKHWHRIADKYGYYTDILCNNLTETAAFDLECFFIRSFGRLDNKTGTLVNLTDGGEGATGRILTPLHRQRISQSNKGRKGTRLGTTLTEETKEKIRISHIGKTHTAEANLKNRNAHLGKKYSEETQKKKSDSLKAWWALRRLNGTAHQTHKTQPRVNGKFARIESSASLAPVQHLAS